MRSDFSSVLILLVVLGGGYWGYCKYQESQQKALAAAKAQVEQDEKDRTAQQEKYKQERLEEERTAAQQHREEMAELANRRQREREAAAAEREQRRLAEETERAQKAAEEFQRQLPDEHPMAPDKLAQNKKAEAPNLQPDMEALMKGLANSRKNLAVIERNAMEAKRKLTAARNIADGAQRNMALAASRAAQWMKEQGWKILDPDNPWGSANTPAPGASAQSQNNAAFQLYQDNREQINKEKQNYDKAKAEYEKMQPIITQCQADVTALEDQLVPFRKEEASYLAALKKLGVTPTSKPMQFPEANIETESKEAIAHLPFVIMKDGSKIEAEKAVDGGDVYSIKTIDGRFVVVKKADIAEMPESLLMKK